MSQASPRLRVGILGIVSGITGAFTFAAVNPMVPGRRIWAPIVGGVLGAAIAAVTSPKFFQVDRIRTLAVIGAFSGFAGAQLALRTLDLAQDDRVSLRTAGMLALGSAGLGGLSAATSVDLLSPPELRLYPKERNAL